ncbi:lactonase family protein, partial [Pricia sp.]|uniref:lactonase family protein n=1 Tax=Pricia sp. TaxID=2268138 RepID=UPI003593BB2C
MEQVFYIGSYSKAGGYFTDINGEGLTLCSLDLQTGQLSRKSSYPEAVNATYLAKYGDNILLIASDQYEEPGNVMSFSIDEDGSLKQLSTQSTQGTATCHVSANKARNQIFVASYMNGRLSVHSIEEGRLSAAKHVHSYEGQGPNTDRQERSHAHCAMVSPSGKWLYVCDLGSDKIWLHDTARLTGEFSEVIGIEVPAGYGPRHLEFDANKDVVYLICELNAHLLTYTLDDSTGMLTLVNDSPTLPDDYNEVPSAAAIR